MAEKLLRKAVVLAKTETTYGTDATPTAAEAILCTQPQLSAVVSKHERDYIRSTLSNAGFAVGRKRMQITFSCELKGPNDAVNANTPTYLDPLFQCCALVGSEKLVNTTEDVYSYDPTSDFASMKSTTIYYWLDGIKHALTGCRGTFSLSFDLENYPKADFTIQGIYNDPADGTQPSGLTLPEYLPPMCTNIGGKIGAYVLKGFERATLDLGNNVVEKLDMNSATGLSGLRITGRSPRLTTLFEMEALSIFNPWTIFKNGTKQDISWTVGAIGNRVLVDCTAAQLEEPKIADSNGTAMWDLSWVLTGIDNELAIQTG